MKILTIVGTRPELIKLSEIIKKLDKHTEHILVHTGQNYDPQLSDVFYKDLDLRRPDVQLAWNGESLGRGVGTNFLMMEGVLKEYKPDAVVILGDTNSAIAGGYLAKRMKIPLFHLEAGNRCFDDNVPEEVNRRILDHISDVNMVYTQGQRLYLRDEGIAKERIFVMGSPMKEVLSKHIDKINASTILQDLKLEFPETAQLPYYLVSIHRDENTNIPENLEILKDTLNAIAEKYNKRIIVTAHPRLVNKLNDASQMDNGILALDYRITLHKPFSFTDYCKLQMNAECVISDSGTIAEESAVLKFPSLTIRNAHERAEATDVGSILMTGVNKESILNCLDIVSKPTTFPVDYSIENTSERVLKVILGYTPYVNRYVYHK